MKQLKNTLGVFSETLLRLYRTGDNFVIGGSSALRLHGLELGRESSDVDIIIYRPTKGQEKVLNSLRLSNSISNPMFGTKSMDEYRTRVIKLQSKKLFGKNYKIDIIISEEEMPKDLLSVMIFDYPIKVQSIKNIIRAKASYTKQVDSRGSTQYISKKDATDFMNLKNLNFNF